MNRPIAEPEPPQVPQEAVVDILRGLIVTWEKRRDAYAEDDRAIREQQDAEFRAYPHPRPLGLHKLPTMAATRMAVVDEVIAEARQALDTAAAGSEPGGAR